MHKSGFENVSTVNELSANLRELTFISEESLVMTEVRTQPRCDEACPNEVHGDL